MTAFSSPKLYKKSLGTLAAMCPQMIFIYMGSVRPQYASQGGPYGDPLRKFCYPFCTDMVFLQCASNSNFYHYFVKKKSHMDFFSLSL